MQIESTEKHVEKAVPRVMTEEMMQQDLAYRFAQKLSQNLLQKGLITGAEFKRLTDINKESYSPYLKELLA